MLIIQMLIPGNKVLWITRSFLLCSKELNRLLTMQFLLQAQRTQNRWQYLQMLVWRSIVLMLLLVLQIRKCLKRVPDVIQLVLLTRWLQMWSSGTHCMKIIRLTMNIRLLSVVLIVMVFMQQTEIRKKNWHITNWMLNIHLLLMKWKFLRKVIWQKFRVGFLWIRWLLTVRSVEQVHLVRIRKLLIWFLANSSFRRMLQKTAIANQALVSLTTLLRKK